MVIFPAGQSMHCVFSSFEYFPAGQVKQSLWPVTFETVPSPQREQDSTPPGEKRPWSHVAHSELLIAYLPGKQSTQKVAPGLVAIEPMPQTVHLELPSLKVKEPAGHGIHVVWSKLVE